MPLPKPDLFGAGGPPAGGKAAGSLKGSKPAGGKPGGAAGSWNWAGDLGAGKKQDGWASAKKALSALGVKPATPGASQKSTALALHKPAKSSAVGGALGWGEEPTATAAKAAKGAMGKRAARAKAGGAGKAAAKGKHSALASDSSLSEASLDFTDSEDEEQAARRAAKTAAPAVKGPVLGASGPAAVGPLAPYAAAQASAPPYAAKQLGASAQSRIGTAPAHGPPHASGGAVGVGAGASADDAAAAAAATLAQRGSALPVSAAVEAHGRVLSIADLGGFSSSHSAEEVSVGGDGGDSAEEVSIDDNDSPVRAGWQAERGGFAGGAPSLAGPTASSVGERTNGPSSAVVSRAAVGQSEGAGGRTVGAAHALNAVGASTTRAEAVGRIMSFAELDLSDGASDAPQPSPRARAPPAADEAAAGVRANAALPVSRRPPAAGGDGGPALAGLALRAGGPIPEAAGRILMMDELDLSDTSDSASDVIGARAAGPLGGEAFGQRGGEVARARTVQPPSATASPVSRRGSSPQRAPRAAVAAAHARVLGGVRVLSVGDLPDLESGRVSLSPDSVSPDSNRSPVRSTSRGSKGSPQRVQAKAERARARSRGRSRSSSPSPDAGRGRSPGIHSARGIFPRRGSARGVSVAVQTVDAGARAHADLEAGADEAFAPPLPPPIALTRVLERERELLTALRERVKGSTAAPRTPLAAWPQPNVQPLREVPSAVHGWAAPLPARAPAEPIVRPIGGRSDGSATQSGPGPLGNLSDVPRAMAALVSALALAPSGARRAWPEVTTIDAERELAECEAGAVAVAAEAVRVRAQLHELNRLRASVAALNAPGPSSLGIRPSSLGHRF
ncbi:hypothetical protein KFE25_003422 [Diacronema lutheri]|uniref:Uncharacterized protein n=1 Tax=Diacronema lutheri TaxID=2081491 RepID=A0A8J5XPJ3_DIALT|nr:hypothetical protein KFE25_003422 [Diacronema lutheri]